MKKWSVEFHGEIEVEADDEELARSLAIYKLGADGVERHLSVEPIDVTPEADCGAGGA